VPSKRSSATPKPDPPITGVATGSLGTAANLEDTQVLRTEDLRAAAAEAGWLSEDEPVGPAGFAGVTAADVIPPDELALLLTPPHEPAKRASASRRATAVAAAPTAPARAAPTPAAREPAAPTAVAPSAPPALAASAPDTVAAAPTAAVTGSAPSRHRRNVPALAGVVAFVALLLIAGSGFLSQLDLGLATGPGSSAGVPSDPPPSASPQPKAQAGKGGGGHGPKGCHGRGHDCGGNQD